MFISYASEKHSYITVCHTSKLINGAIYCYYYYNIIITVLGFFTSIFFNYYYYYNYYFVLLLLCYIFILLLLLLCLSFMLARNSYITVFHTRN